MPKLKNCECWACKHKWQDFPGQWARLTRPQFAGDPRNGCPNCGALYWTEIEQVSA